jgi:hypothetical protein
MRFLKDTLQQIILCRQEHFFLHRNENLCTKNLDNHVPSLTVELLILSLSLSTKTYLHSLHTTAYTLGT